MMLKRGLSVLLSAVLLMMCFFCVPVCAAESEFDISEYTWEDIMTMSNEDFRVLLANFERVYDPLGTYEENPLAQDLVEQNNFGIQPFWTSGKTNIKGEITSTGSHELITARACGVLLADKGFWGKNHNESLVISLTISLASIAPDKEFLLGLGDAFKGHFYDPDTEENWARGTSNTAKTNTEKFYAKAKAEYAANGSSSNYLEYVGKMLHYVQDASEPHHAANITGGIKGNVHGKFEDYADQHLNSYIDNLTSLGNTSYANALNLSVGGIVKETAKIAKGYAPSVSDVNNQSQWDSVAGATTRNAVRYSAMLIYKLSVEANIPLTK